MTLTILAGLAGCKQDKIDVRKESAGDYNHAALQAAVDTFVAKGRTPVGPRS